MAVNTLENASGRSQAAVKAQTAPLLAPPIALSLPIFESIIALPSVVFFFSTYGKISSKMNFTYVSPKPSNSKLRLNLSNASSGFEAFMRPCITNTPIVIEYD